LPKVFEIAFVVGYDHSIKAHSEVSHEPFTGHRFLDLACDVVRAHLDLLRVREVKRDLMERMYAHGTVDLLRRFCSISDEVRFVMGQPLDQPLRLPQRVNPLGPMPVDEDERVAEAMRRLLPARWRRPDQAILLSSIIRRLTISRVLRTFRKQCTLFDAVESSLGFLAI
jgi:hypothetical protein